MLGLGLQPIALHTGGSVLRQLGLSGRPQAMHRRGARWGRGRCRLCPQTPVVTRAVGRWPLGF
eukprot:9965368-Alexandrium_andersonii.AAC.1